MKKLFCVIASMLVCSGSLFAQNGVRLDFSVYYPGSSQQSATSSGKTRSLALVSDLHYALGKKNVPLHIKQGRQTILYPYRGSSTFSLFRVKGDETRDMVTSVKVPAGVKKAIFLLLDDPKAKGGYKLYPFWMNQNVAKKGHIRILNKSGKSVAMMFDKGKTGQKVLKDNAALTIPGKFSNGQNAWFTTMEAFVTKDKSKPYKYKVIHRDLAADKGDTSVYLMVGKRGSAVDLLSLSLAGADNPIQQDRLSQQVKPEDLNPGT